MPAQDHTMRPQPLRAEETAGSLCRTRAWASRPEQGHSHQPCRDLSLNWSRCLKNLPYCSCVHTLAQRTSPLLCSHVHTHTCPRDLTQAPTSTHTHSPQPKQGAQYADIYKAYNALLPSGSSWATWEDHIRSRNTPSTKRL